MIFERHIGVFGCCAIWSFAAYAAAFCGFRLIEVESVSLARALGGVLFLSAAVLVLLGLTRWTLPTGAAWRPALGVATVGSLFAALAVDAGVVRLEAAMGWRAWAMLGLAVAIEVALIAYGFVQQRRTNSQNLGAGA